MEAVMQVIDLRSDTITSPTPEMRDVIRDAEVGDDEHGDDPTINRLQEEVAALFGKEAACFVASGTMANQTAIRAQTEPGDEVIGHPGSHIIHYESGALSAIGGVQLCPVAAPGRAGERGFFTPEQVEAAVRPDEAYYPKTALLACENTHNRGGGSVWPYEQLAAVAAKAASLGLRRHLDGARIWNACAATGLKPADYARHFDTVSCCFSKGLGAPAGSAVVGDRATIKRVLRFRKMCGGAMRQVGLLGAAALYAIEHHFPRLADDHAKARALAEGIGAIDGLSVDAREIDTNIVYFGVDPAVSDADTLCDRLEAGVDGVRVRMFSITPESVRAVCHLDVRAEDIPVAVEAIARAVRGGS
jgi:threonine aldolase